MRLFVLALLVAGSIATQGDRKKFIRGQRHTSGLPTHRNDYIESSTLSPSSALSPSTSSPTTTTSDPCDSCRNQPITISDTWAGHCFADDGGAACNCLCGDVFCSNGEVMDRLTCTTHGRLQDCKCSGTSTIAPTTAPPTPDPFVGCERCIKSKLSVGDTFAGHCFPNRSPGGCSCICADVFCKDGQTIDRTTCVSGGSLNDCRCIGTSVSTTTSTTTPISF